MINAVSFRELHFAYKAGSPVLAGYSADIPKSTVTAILGANGRGKTTLIRLLLGLIKPTSGTIITNGHTALVPQLFQVTFAFSVLDMVVMGRARRIGFLSKPSREDIEASREALSLMGIADLADKSFHTLSGGQRQLVILARALVAEADILMMDEPASVLDLKNQAMVINWMHRLAHENGLTVIFTTHQPNHALAVTDSVLIMRSSSEYNYGRTNEVMTDKVLEEMYGIPLKHIEFDHGGAHYESFAPVFMNKNLL